MMIRLIKLTLICTILLILLHPTASFSLVSKIDKFTCSYQGKKIYGKVQIVETFPDVKVKVVTSLPDLKVKPVVSLPDRCGKWQIVESFPDLKVQFVEALEDIKIRFVESSPGIP